MKIEKIDAYQVFDSRGNPTLEAEVVLKNGEKATAIVPSGASTGQYEALELRDNIPDKFQGKSVYQAIDNVRKKIHPALKEKDVFRQSALDEIMLDLDGTDNKHNLGANAILGVSMAAARAAANAADIPLYDYLSDGNGTVIPLPEIQIIGGGAHSAGRIDIQDFMVICTGAPTYADCLEMTFNIYHHCGQILKEENKLAGVADEGGFWPEFSSNQEVFDVILRAIEKAGYKPGKEVHLSLDIAASELYSDGQYHLLLEERSLSAGEFYKVIAGWCEKYPIISIEDPFSETDLENWKRFTEKYGPNMQIIGDDLFTTDIHRVRQGKEDKLANSVLIKLNRDCHRNYCLHKAKPGF